MNIIYGFEALPQIPAWKNLVLAMGNFDGVHLGHQHILQQSVESARTLNGNSLCLTFAPHPLKVLASQHAPQLIQTDFQKFLCIARQGIEYLLVQHFDTDFARIEYEDFFERYIVRLLHPKAIRVGCRFAFGHDRKGNAENLARLSFTSEMVPPRTSDFTISGRPKYSGSEI